MVTYPAYVMLHLLMVGCLVNTSSTQSNILILDDGSACIADFGLSTLLTELGRPTFATSFHGRGTIQWIAPELLVCGASENGAEEALPVLPTTYSDVYSFGGVMLHVCGSRQLDKP